MFRDENYNVLDEKYTNSILNVKEQKVHELNCTKYKLSKMKHREKNFLNEADISHTYQ